MIFDGYLNAGSKDDSEIRNYYTQTQEVKIAAAYIYLNLGSAMIEPFVSIQVTTLYLIISRWKRKKIMCCAVLFVREKMTTLRATKEPHYNFLQTNRDNSKQKASMNQCNVSETYDELFKRIHDYQVILI